MGLAMVSVEGRSMRISSSAFLREPYLKLR
jgi:hypothetical protein